MTFESVQTAKRRLEDLPSRKGLPFLGNALELNPKRLHLILEEWARELGDVFTIAIGNRKILVSADSAHIQTSLRDRPDGFKRLSMMSKVAEEMGWHGVLTAEGPSWRAQRLLVTRALATPHFRGFFPTLQAITHRLLLRWEQAARLGHVVHMTDDLTRYTVDVTTALAFGEDPNTLEKDSDPIQAHLARIFPMLNSRMNAAFPLWRYFKLPKDHQLDHSLSVIKSHIAGLIDRARRRMRLDPAEQPRNLLETMLEAAQEPGSMIDEELIVANVMTLLLAGEDTTAHTLAWTMKFLAEDATLQDRLHSEASAAFASDRVCASYEGVQSLALFESVALESTRFKPIIPMMFLESATDVDLGDIAVPEGTGVFLLLRPSMLDEQNFGSPHQFVADRWTAGHGAVEPHDGRAYAQFGAGPRVCPGRHLANVELRLVISMLARNFKMRLACDPASIEEVPGFTMMPSAVPVHLELREP